jgi:hypothetical protein
MSSSTEQQFLRKFRRRLDGLRKKLEPVLAQLIIYNYPPEVAALDFEVFSDTWSGRFPARAFFLDKENTEFFVYEKGTATYPCSVDPSLLQDEILSWDEEQGLLKAEPALEISSLGVNEFVLWFAQAWVAARGQDFPLSATIAEHDADKEFNLVVGKWQERYASF